MGQRLTELRALLDELEQRAPKLREAGVRKFSFGTIAVELGEADVKIPKEVLAAIAEAERKARDERMPSDPLQDPDTYNLKGGVPGFDLSEIEKRDHEED